MNKTVTTVIVLTILVVGGFLVFSGDSSQPQEPADQQATTTDSMDDSELGMMDDNSTSTEKTDSSDDTGTTTSTSSSQNEPTDAPAVTVTYEDGQFSPQEVTVESGQTVRFESSGEDMWVGVNQHPTHTQYDGSNLDEHCQQENQESFDQCETGDSYSFTFEKTGEFGYHNHVNPSAGGTVIVQ